MNNKESFVNNVPMKELLEKVPNRFLLSVAVAKRSKQLKDGVRALLEAEEGAEAVSAADEDLLPVLTALQEIDEDKIKIYLKDEDIEETDVIDEMDEALEAELEADGDSDDKKGGPKDKGNKSKSKSLAA